MVQCQKEEVMAVVADMHLYIVAVEVDMKNVIKEAGFVLREMGKFDEIKRQFDRDIPYLYYENQSGEKYITDAPNVYPQYIRCLIADKMNQLALSSWQNNHQLPWMIDIVKRLRPILKKKVDDNLWVNSSFE